MKGMWSAGKQSFQRRDGEKRRDMAGAKAVLQARHALRLLLFRSQLLVGLFLCVVLFLLLVRVQDQLGSLREEEEEEERVGWLLDLPADEPKMRTWRRQWEERNLSVTWTGEQDAESEPNPRPDVVAGELEMVDTRELNPRIYPCIPSRAPVLLSVGDYGAIACPVLKECKRGKVRAVCADPSLEDPEYPASLPIEDEPTFITPKHGEVMVRNYPLHRGGVAFLANVFTNNLGHAFDSSSVFFKGGCREVDRARPVVKAGYALARLPLAISLASGHSNNHYHGLAELLPRIVLLLPALRALPGAAVLIADRDAGPVEAFFRLLGETEPGPGRVRLLGDRDLVRADVLVVAHAPRCAKASPSLWRRIRRSHFRVPRRAGREWYVVLEERTGSRGLEQHAKLLAGLERKLGSARIKVFSDSVNWTMEATKELFSRAAVLVGPHGAGMSNMVFMPPESAVVEVRPSNFSNPCFHTLADALRFSYYRIDAPGVKSSRMNVDVESTVALVASVARALNPQRRRHLRFYPQLVAS